MISVQTFLALVGGIIVLGFLGNYFFKITRIPTSVLLMLCGLILRPFVGITNQAVLYSVAPYFGTIALLLILFEGGLELEIRGVLTHFLPALLLGLVYFLLCGSAIYSLLRYSEGFPPHECLLYAFVLSGTSPGILIPTLPQLSISNELRTFLTIETNVSELLTVVGTILFLEFTGPGMVSPDSAQWLGHGVQILGMALLLGGSAGFFWVRFLSVMASNNLAYILTLGFLFLLYSATEWVGGKGTLAVLFFGLFLGDAPWLVSKLPLRLQRSLKPGFETSAFQLDDIVKQINAEFSFLVRSFFFVFMGLLVDFRAFTPNLTALLAGVVGILFLSRWVASRSAGRFSKALAASQLSVSLAMVPRGLANAVVAFAAIQAGAIRNKEFLQLILGVVLVTNVLMAVMVIQSESHNDESVKEELARP